MSLLKQLSIIAEAEHLDIKYEFGKPPGYKFRLGAKEKTGQFIVHLTLAGEQVDLKLIGEGTQPYQAKREAAVKGKAFLYIRPISNDTVKQVSEHDSGAITLSLD